jgi:tetratricopeptide (TPR) repeat protein
MAELHCGDHASAVTHLERALHLKRAQNDRLGEATILNNLGVVYYRRGHDRVARDYYAFSLAVKGEIGDRYGEAIALTNLALMDTRLGESESAGRHLESARQAALEVGASWLVPEIHRVSAIRALEIGDVSLALREAEGALETAEELGVPSFIGAAHRVMGLVKGLGHAGPSDEHFETSLAVYEMLGDEHELAKTHADYAAALCAEGRRDDAAPHAALARAIFERTGADGRLSRLDSLL